MFSRLIIVLYFVLILFLINSCYYIEGCYHQNRKSYMFKESYSNDTLFVSDYILFGTYRRKRLEYGVVRMNNDSLFNIFKESVNNAELPIYFDNKERNLSNKNMIESYHSRASDIDIESINRFTTIEFTDDLKRVMIPVIKFNFHSDNHCGSPGCDKYYVTHLSLSIYIIENNELIYYKKIRCVEKSDFSIPDYYDYYQVPIPKEKWNTVLKKVMKEYTERLN